VWDPLLRTSLFLFGIWSEMHTDSAELQKERMSTSGMNLHIDVDRRARLFITGHYVAGPEKPLRIFRRLQGMQLYTQIDLNPWLR
jgi:hypothetical protein